MVMSIGRKDPEAKKLELKHELTFPSPIGIMQKRERKYHFKKDSVRIQNIKNKENRELTHDYSLFLIDSNKKVLNYA